MAYLKFCFLFLCVSFVLSEEDFCSESNMCRCILRKDSKVIDLSAVGYLEHPRFYQVPLDLPKFNGSKCTTELYSYNPCFPFDSHDQYTLVADGYSSCTEASACIRKPGGSDGSLPEEHAIGLQITAKFGGNDSMTYINYTVPNTKAKPLLVKLVCDSSSTVHTLSIDTPDCMEDNMIILTLTSKCACPDGCPSTFPPEPVPPSTGLSTGSKLLIAFFTILLAYFLIGIVWNYCNGSHGMELVPNIEFWNDLPTLIMEGVTFVCSCCAKPSSYGAV